MARSELLAALAAVLVAVLIAGGFWGFSFDDNFITYRYARNLLAGEGLTYNSGEWVLGTTAPGYAVVLAGLAAVTRTFGPDVPGWGSLLSLGSLLWLAWTLHRLLDRRRTFHSLAFAGLALTFPLNLHLLGSELFPVSALIAEALLQLFVRKRHGVAGLLVCAAMFLRLDAGLAALVFGVVAWWRTRRLPLRYALAGVLPLVPWLAALSAVYGGIVPLTLTGKTALRQVPYTLRQWEMLTLTLPTPVAVLVVVGAVCGLWAGWRGGWHRRPWVVAAALWLTAHELAYRAAGVWFSPWYHVALIQATLALLIAGLSHLVGSSFERLAPRASPPRRGAATLLALFLVLTPCVTWVGRQWGRPPDPRFPIYQAAGSWIHRHLPPDAEILALEIGVLGYESQRRILDFGGLVSPAFAAAKMAGTRARLASGLAPRYVLLVEEDEMLGAVLAEPALEGRYALVQEFEHPRFGRGRLRLLGRLDPAAGGEAY